MIHPPRHLLLTIAAIVLLVPGRAGSNREPYEQVFLITAYYSPLPGQCCYVRGGYDADKVLNGEGVAAADGTAVYPGMLAAPASYAFGTKVKLPGLGVLAVHDRGGAIQELAGGVHRLDIWAGYGEEGLARALAFGAQTMRGTVYPPGFEQPQTHLDLADLPAPLARLEEFRLGATTLLSVRAKKGDVSYSARMLQESLAALGYFRHPATGQFGDVTEEALGRFLRDYHVDASPNELTPEIAAHILSALHRQGVESPVTEFVDAQSDSTTLREAQRTLRFLGYYGGRTDGTYSDALASAILRFQQENFLVGTKDDPGAGRIGPVTMRALRGAWDRELVSRRADTLLTLRAVEEKMRIQKRAPDRFLSEGDSGSQVRILQSLLAERGFFPAPEINGNFGPRTREAVVRYQQSRGIIARAADHGAGTVGPSTLSALQREERRELFSRVRAEGWRVL